MKLRDALRSTETVLAGFTGSGGKTTALFTLARQYDGPVLVTASTHLGRSQFKLADRSWVIAGPGDVKTALRDARDTRVALFTGEVGADDRSAGLDEASLLALRDEAVRRGIPLLIEADGSRCKPLKAAAAHEPNLPDWVNLVVVVAGLSGLGHPLTEDTVHRSQLFSDRTGLAVGDPVTPDALARYLAHPLGGLKRIPGGAKKVALLNQAEDQAGRIAADRIARMLTGWYDAVLAASLQAPDAGEQVLWAREPVAGVILAAGEAKRFGAPKVLLDWRGKPLVWHAANSAVRAGLDQVIVVAGNQYPEIARALSDLPVQVVVNDSWQAGQASSLQAGLGALDERCGAVVFLLGDQPLTPASVISRLVETHAQTLAPVVYPSVQGRRANPVLFDRNVFPAFAGLSGDVGGRALFGQFSQLAVPVDDDRLLFDVDTPEDYDRLLGFSGEDL